MDEGQRGPGTVPHCMVLYGTVAMGVKNAMAANLIARARPAGLVRINRHEQAGDGPGQRQNGSARSVELP